MKIIFAPPGSGKTRRLVNTINEAIESGANPFQILACTFSREATAELATRTGGDVPCRTIHGTALWIIRLARQARGDRPLRVISADKQRALIERAYKELEIKFIDLEQVIGEIARVRERGGNKNAMHPITQRVADRYFQIMTAENYIDFTGLLEEAVRELDDPELQEFLSGTSLYIDEGHDVNPRTEWPLLEKLAKIGQMAGKSEVLMVASPSQQIYRFRGADWSLLEQLLPPDVEFETMTRNYRSTPEIIEASKPLAGPDARQMDPMRESIHCPVIVGDALNPEMEIDLVGKTVALWMEQEIPAQQITVLTRSHTMLGPIQRLLRTRDMPFQLVSAKSDMYSREEILAAYGYLRLAINPRDDTTLEEIINFPPCGIGERTRYQIRGNGRLTWNHLISVIASDPGKYRPQVVQRCLHILDYRELAEQVVSTSSMRLLDKVAKLLEMTEIPDYLISEGDFSGVQGINGLVKSVSEYGSVKEFSDQMGLEILQPRGQSGINLGTLHASKGREWKAVLLFGCQDGIMPLAKSDPEEERNLAFVGMTRAMDRLMITMQRTAQPSPFFANLPAASMRWP